MSNGQRLRACAPTASKWLDPVAAVVADAAVVHRAHVDQDRAERAVARLFEPIREVELVADLHVRRRAAPLEPARAVPRKMIQENECGVEYRCIEVSPGE